MFEDDWHDGPELDEDYDSDEYPDDDEYPQDNSDEFEYLG